MSDTLSRRQLLDEIDLHFYPHRGTQGHWWGPGDPPKETEFMRISRSICRGERARVVEAILKFIQEMP